MDQHPSNHGLPVVPDALRALAARQQHAALSVPAPIKLYMQRAALLMRNMQLVILDRQRAYRPSTGNAMADPSEWTRLLGEFDAAVLTLRQAYASLNAGRRALKQLPPTPAGQDFYEATLPAFEAIMEDPFAEINAAMQQWEAVTAKYLRMMQGTYRAHAHAA